MLQGTPTLTDMQHSPQVMAARAVLNSRRPRESDKELAERAGLSKQQMNAIVNHGGGINLESAVRAARKLGWSLDDLFELDQHGRPPTEQERAYREIAAIVMETEGRSPESLIGERLGPGD